MKENENNINLAKEITHTTQEIILCSSCEGSGILQWEECVDYHKGDYETHQKQCNNCNGTGRQLHTKKISNTYEPFNAINMAKINLRKSLK